MPEPPITAHSLVSSAIDALSQTEAEAFVLLTDEILDRFGLGDVLLSAVTLPDLMRYASLYLAGREETAYLNTLQRIVASRSLAEPNVGRLLREARHALLQPGDSATFTRCTNGVLDHFRLRGRLRREISASTLAVLAESIKGQLATSYLDWITIIVEALAPSPLTEHLP